MCLHAAERAALDRQLLFITTPALRSTWPSLPLVRRTRGEEEFGLLFDALDTSGQTGFSATVFTANLFLLPPTFEEFLAPPKEVFDTTEELLAAHWRVD